MDGEVLAAQSIILDIRCVYYKTRLMVINYHVNYHKVIFLEWKAYWHVLKYKLRSLAILWCSRYLQPLAAYPACPLSHLWRLWCRCQCSHPVTWTHPQRLPNQLMAHRHSIHRTWKKVILEFRGHPRSSEVSPFNRAYDLHGWGNLDLLKSPRHAHRFSEC